MISKIFWNIFASLTTLFVVYLVLAFVAGTIDCLDWNIWVRLAYAFVFLRVVFVFVTSVAE